MVRTMFAYSPSMPKAGKALERMIEKGFHFITKQGFFKHKFMQKAGALKSSGRDMWQPILGETLVEMTSMHPSDPGPTLPLTRGRTVHNCPSAAPWRVVRRGDAVQPSGRQKAGLPMANLSRFPKSNIFCEVEPSVFSGMQNECKVYELYMCQNMEISYTHLWEKGSENSHCVRLEGIMSVLPEK